MASRKPETIKGYFRNSEQYGVPSLSMLQYDSAFFVMRDNLPKARNIINFGCGPLPYEVQPRIAQQVLSGISTRFLHVDISKRAIDAHKKAVEGMKSKGMIHPESFSNDAYLHSDLEELDSQEVQRALQGEKPHAGLAIDFLLYYPLSRQAELITKMLKHCDSLICNVGALSPEAKDLARELMQQKKSDRELHTFDDVYHIQKALSHKDWAIKKMLGVPGLNDGITGNFFLLIQSKKAGK